MLNNKPTEFYLLLRVIIHCRKIKQPLIKTFGIWPIEFSITYFYGVIKRAFIQFQTSGIFTSRFSKNFHHLLPNKGVAKTVLSFKSKRLQHVYLYHLYIKGHNIKVRRDVKKFREKIFYIRSLIV